MGHVLTVARNSCTEMPVRLYMPEDRERILALRQAHGEKYFFSDPDLWPTHSTVVQEEEGAFIGALSGRMCVEGFLMVDPRVPPLKRWRTIKELVSVGLPWIHEQTGVGEAHVCIPQELDGYARLLEKQPGFYPENRVRLMVNLTQYGKEKK